MPSTDDQTSMTPARQVVELFRSSAGALPAREDFDIAASVLFEDPELATRMYDMASLVRSSPMARRPLTADFRSVRAFAAALIESGDMAALRASVGGTLPRECEDRLEAAGRDDVLARHLRATAADHFASQAIDALEALTGRTDGEIVVHGMDDETMGRLRDTPFFCLLGKRGDENA